MFRSPLTILLLTLCPTVFASALQSLPTPTTIIPSATPAQPLFSSFPTPTPAPTPFDLSERCSNGDCGGPGPESTLSASVVTTTIVSTTSVPCYITTYITDSTTVTSTVYSTEIITSTVTKEGTVYIIQYSPTPILMSTLVESVTEITNTWWSYWLTSGGSAYQVTSTGQEQSIGGGTQGGYTQGADHNSGVGSGSGWHDHSGGDNGDSGSGSAWTHATANNAMGLNPTSVPAFGGGGASGDDGWGDTETHNNGGWGSSGTTRGGWGSGSSGGGGVNWNAARKRGTFDASWKLVLGSIGVFLVWEAINPLL
ncbi:hypothetical protein IAR55_007105 [Kwoniella newhampshirensis]|uniref:Uncharacterized protein n=1 Tax=Kwoniella newhampshirensis TaxID=1651941 RepID=A0AAW0YQ96_9TREE